MAVITKLYVNETLQRMITLMKVIHPLGLDRLNLQHFDRKKALITHLTDDMDIHPPSSI